MDVKNADFKQKCYVEKVCIFLNFSCSSRARAGPIWAHTGPDGPIWAHMDPKNPKRYVINEIAFIGAFKGPCTLP